LVYSEFWFVNRRCHKRLYTFREEEDLHLPEVGSLFLTTILVNPCKFICSDKEKCCEEVGSLTDYMFVFLSDIDVEIKLEESCRHYSIKCWSLLLSF